MKKIYWRPRQISRAALVLIAVFALCGYIAVETFQTKTQQPHYVEKLAAARLAREAMDVIRAERENRALPIDVESDPAQSGMIGELISPVTSDPGSLPAKQTSVNPNFAAVVVEMLKEAPVEAGDTVAIGFSGSFPALNVAVLAAVQTLKLKPVIISSAAASQWGANHPDLLWCDMERVLYDRGVFKFRSVASSIGGIEDRGVGMAAQGRERLIDAVNRNGLRLIQAKSFAESIEERMAIYREHAGAAPIKAYINVGGGTTSVGTRVGKRMFEPGLNVRPPPGTNVVESVMTRFSEQGTPVIHLIQIEQLAQRYGLPIQPRTIPIVGEGKVFYRNEYNPWLTGGVLVAIVASLFAFVRSEWGLRMLRRPSTAKDAPHAEPMI